MRGAKILPYGHLSFLATGEPGLRGAEILLRSHPVLFPALERKIECGAKISP